MEWKFRFGGREVAYTIIEPAAAVRPTEELLALTTPSDLALMFGTTAENKNLADTLGEGSLPSSNRLIFEQAGWVFVEPFNEVAVAAEVRADLPGATAARQVILSDAGDLMVTTSRVTVQLKAENNLSDDEATEWLKQDGLQLSYRLNFAPNLFEATLPQERLLRDWIGELQEKTNRYVFVEPVFKQVITGRFHPIDADFGKQWQHRNPLPGFTGCDLHSEAAWEKTRGTGVRIAVIDHGGHVNHPDIKDGIVGGAHFGSDNGGKASFARLVPGATDFPPGDHGTFCLGMAGARANNALAHGGCGSAPEADLLAIACLTELVGTQNTLARAVAYAADPRCEEPAAAAADGADVISCSLGPRVPNWDAASALDLAIKFASHKGRGGRGVPIFWAVSNELVAIAKDQISSHRDVIAVGSSNRQDSHGGSAFGSELEFLAPGREVFSTRGLDQFAVSSGTSFATPLAAGVAALVIALNKDLTASEIRAKLRQSCDKIGGVTYGPDNHNDLYGFGRLNAELAVS